ncbi:MAG TPA: polysaccharide biosynthesis/export family protein [Opitutaceae bacterium]|nr:polysaccharide biosynthesis/export family protein [Opitutaceae bacterium]
MKEALRHVIAAAAMLSAALPCARADDPGAASNPGKAPAYTIRSTDKLSIRVFQEDDLTTISRVDSKGTVNLPLVGEVRVSGQTLSDAGRTIESAYRDGRFLRNPQVTVSVEEYAPREVSINGQVKNPGRFPLPVESTMTVLDLVTKAGGFTDTAQGTEVRVTRSLPDGTTRVITLDVESLIKGKGNSKSNQENSALRLEPDDIVYVPERII